MNRRAPLLLILPLAFFLIRDIDQAAAVPIAADVTGLAALAALPTSSPAPVPVQSTPAKPTAASSAVATPAAPTAPATPPATKPAAPMPSKPAAKPPAASKPTAAPNGCGPNGCGVPSRGPLFFFRRR